MHLFDHFFTYQSKGKLGQKQSGNSEVALKQAMQSTCSLLPLHGPKQPGLKISKIHYKAGAPRYLRMERNLGKDGSLKKNKVFRSSVVHSQ